MPEIAGIKTEPSWSEVVKRALCEHFKSDPADFLSGKQSVDGHYMVYCTVFPSGSCRVIVSAKGRMIEFNAEKFDEKKAVKIGWFKR